MSERLTTALALVLATILSAGPAAVAASPNYLDEIAVMDAQIAVAKKQTELRSALQGLAGSQAGLPQVVSVAGFDPDLSAVVRYPGGRKRTVRKGDRLPGGVEVKSVASTGVVVRFAKVETSLEFEAALQAGGEHRQAVPPPELLPPVPRVNVPLPSALVRPAMQTQSPAPSAAATSPQGLPASTAGVAQPQASAAAQTAATGKALASAVPSPALAIEK